MVTCPPLSRAGPPLGTSLGESVNTAHLESSTVECMIKRERAKDKRGRKLFDFNI